MGDTAVMSGPSHDGPLVLIVGVNVPATEVAASAWIDDWRMDHPEGTVLVAPEPREWPFRYPLVPALPSGPVVVRASGIHSAFINHQTGSTRLVTTQAMFLCETWADALRAHGDATLVATGDATSLKEHASEILARRSLFASAVLEAAGGEPAPQETAQHDESRLPAALRALDPAERLKLCIEALNLDRTAAALVATGSACMEVNDLQAAGRDLDEALALAPDWAAAHFERGKLWLRMDDMPRASESFRAAARALPGFASAWANLGATLGELDRPTEALEAFEHALACDPTSFQALNNVGVVRRELGRLAESEAAFRRVIQLVPELAFGYYNLGHTLFLQGRYQAALSAYAEGQGRDAEKNPVQATRLALCKVATGDAAGRACATCRRPRRRCQKNTGGNCWRTRARCCGRWSRRGRICPAGSQCTRG